MRLFFFFIIFFFLNTKYGYSLNFKNYLELSECVDTYNSFNGYKLKLNECFKNQGINLDRESIKLIDNKSGIIDEIIDLKLPNEEALLKKKSFKEKLNEILNPDLEKIAQEENIFNKPSVFSENYNEAKNFTLDNKDFSKLNNHIKNNPKDIYAVTEDINYLTFDRGYLSELKRKEALLNIYNSFNPKLLIDLKPNTINTNTALAGSNLGVIALAGVAGLAAAGGGGGGNSKPSGPATISYTISSSSTSECGATITITANLTKAHSSNVSITYSAGGTATNGVDYNLSSANSTIVSGGTSAAITLSPVNDTINETSETVIITANTTDVSSTGNTSTTITIHDYVLACNSTAYSEDTSVQNTIINRSSWTEVDKSGNNLHPYELTNLHKAHSYKNSGGQYLTGEGETIFIIDNKFTPAHETYNNKTVTVIDATTPSTTSHNHGDHVASIAAGDINGTTQGVAPDADLVLASFSTSSIANLATDLDTARTNHAPIVVNNSWGLQQGCVGGVCTSALTFDEVKTAASNNGVTFRDEMANSWGGSSSVSSFITALDNFQNNGVIVWASSNYVNDSDVGVEGGLPAYFDGVQDSVDLSDAWISVMYADFTGSSLTGASTTDFTRRGNPCGNAKEWCLVVDDFDINAASHVDAGGTSQYTRLSGSSMGAPQVSGMIALLGQAFPNHTPEQLTDRLLASANNAWFTPTGNTTFTTHGASIQHGYNDEWGHGVPDIYAALSPITTSKNPLSFGGGGGSGGGGSGGGGSGKALPFSALKKFPVSQTSFKSASSLGNSISKGLSQKYTYAYDALHAGFKFNLSDFVVDENIENQRIKISLDEEMDKLRNFNHKINNKYKFKGEFLNFKNKFNYGSSITLNYPNLAIQNSFPKNNFYKNPFLSENNGIGFNQKLYVSGNDLFISYNNSKLNPLTNINHNIILPIETLAISFDLKNNFFEDFSIVGGIIKEEESFLLSESSGAFAFEEDNITNFYGINLSKKFINGGILSFNNSFGLSNFKNNYNNFIVGSSDVLSTNFEIDYELNNIFGDDRFNLSVSQPNRVEKGNMKFRLIGLSDKNGIIPYNDHIINLSPSGRQKDLILSYYKSINENINLGVKTFVSDDVGHRKRGKLDTNILISGTLSF